VERWATFDCYGTLVDWRVGIRRELARLFGEGRSEELLSHYYRAEPVLQATGALSYRQVLAGTLARVAADFGLVVPDDEEDALARSLPAWPVFPEARAALTEARGAGWRLGILSNTDRDLIDASVAVLGVPFDRVVVASEIGSYKPATRHWQVFAEQTGVPRGRQIHVAQSLFHDIATANELGIPSLWINRLGEIPDPEPTRELPDLVALTDTLDDLLPS
jgi:2-haloacid dehalogenase